LVGVQEALQDEDGGNLIDHGAVIRTGTSGSVQVPVGFGGGEALVPEVDRKTSLFAQDAGEFLGLGGLGAQISGHVKRIANNDFGAIVFTDKAGERFEILPAIRADEGEDGLRGQTERVGDGNTNTAISDVEAH
jgi:hypothetical protein